jgi:cation transport ATPase
MPISSDDGDYPVGLFRPYERDKKTEATPPEETAPGPGDKKGRPTPSRKEAEAARMAAIHPKLTRREIRRKENEAETKRRNAAYEAMEAAPERVLMRNYIDYRWSATEFLLPVLVLLLAMSLLTAQISIIYFLATILMWLVFLVVVVNIFIYWRGFRAELAVRYPNATTKGLLFPFISRMITMRRMRNPPTAISRHEKY